MDVNKKNNIIGLKNDDTLLVKIDDIKDLKEMVANFKTIRKNSEGLATIKDSKRFKPEISVENKDILKIKLINYLDNDINNQVEKQFEVTCKSLGLNLEFVEYTDEIKVFKIDYDEKSFAILQEFEGILSIEDMPILDITIDFEINTVVNNMPIKVPSSRTDHSIVGVL